VSSFSWEPFGRARDAGADDAPFEAPAAEAPAAPLPPQQAQPRRRLAILTCMDARIDPLAVLGLTLGDANVMRNAGAVASDDVLRSLGAAVEKLGVVRAVVMGHTDCAGFDSDNTAAAAGVADSVRRIRGAMPHGFAVDAFMYDVSTGTLNPL
jgi:carbonic anhydrase